MNMHENKLFKFLALLIICISINASAQQPGSTLAQQYDEVVNKAGSYQGHKEIRETKLQALWRNVTDSLQREKQLLIESRAKLAKNSQVITGLKTGMNEQEKNLSESEASNNEVKLLGIPVSKSTYNLLMWGLVFILAAALTFTTLRTKASLKEASYRSALYNDLFDELREYKSRANEKEKKLARELQTERNRIAELSGHVR